MTDIKLGSYILIGATVLYALAAGLYWYQSSRTLGAMYACYGAANICAIMLAEGFK